MFGSNLSYSFASACNSSTQSFNTSQQISSGKEPNGNQRDRYMQQNIKHRIKQIRCLHMRQQVQDSKLKIKMSRLILQNDMKEFRHFVEGNQRKSLKILQGNPMEVSNYTKISQYQQDISRYYLLKSKQFSLKEQKDRVSTMIEQIQRRTSSIETENESNRIAKGIGSKAKEAILQKQQSLKSQFRIIESEEQQTQGGHEDGMNLATEANNLIEQFNRILELQYNQDVIVGDINLIHTRNITYRQRIVRQAISTNSFNNILQKYFPQSMTHLKQKKSQLERYVSQIEQLGELSPAFKLKLFDIRTNLSLHDPDPSLKVVHQTSQVTSQQHRQLLNKHKLQRWMRNNLSRQAVLQQSREEPKKQTNEHKDKGTRLSLKIRQIQRKIYQQKQKDTTDDDDCEEEREESVRQLISNPTKRSKLLISPHFNTNQSQLLPLPEHSTSGINFYTNQIQTVRIQQGFKKNPSKLNIIQNSGSKYINK